MDLALRGFAERNDARIQAVDQGSKGKKVQRGIFTYF